MTDIDFSIEYNPEESTVTNTIFNFDIGESTNTFNLEDTNYEINLFDSTTFDVDMVQSFPVDLAWGQIIGDLSNQTDLQTELDLKYDSSDFTTDFNTNFALKDTDDLTEGTNKYDKTVVFTGGSNVTIGGTYPNFTITDNSGTSNLELEEVNTLRQNLSAGLTSTPTYLDNGDGSVTIGDAECRLYSTSDYTGTIDEYSVEGNTFDLKDLDTNYIVIDYNSGNPIMKNILDVSLINESDIIPVYTLVRRGTNICKINWNLMANGLVNKLHFKDVKLNRFEIENGLALGEIGTRNITIGSGIVWNGTKRNNLNIVNTSSGDKINLFYHSSGIWNCSQVSQYNNTQYDDGTNLVNLLPNRYAVNWVFRTVNEDEEDVCVVLGNGNYTLSDAESSTLPTLPQEIIDSCVFVGRIIVQRNSSIAYTIEQVQNISLSYTQISDHNNLMGLQGGTIDEYYHLTSLEYSYLDYLNQDVKTTSNPTFNELSVSSINSTLTDFEHLNVPSEVTEPNQNDLRIANSSIEFYDGSEWQSADCPKIITIKKESQSEGDIHISDETYWNTSKSILNVIKIKTDSTNWNLWLIQNGNGYLTDDARISKFQLMKNGYLDKNICLGNFPYEDEDDGKEVHLYFEDVAGTNTFDITIQGVKAR